MTRHNLGILILCTAVGFGAVSIAHAKFTHDMAKNWEWINE
ncbi:hypothetical protein [uncultured Ruegeria sp.]|nr:hypothetical protein [uncultured Ruegeria sp.]